MRIGILVTCAAAAGLMSSTAWAAPLTSDTFSYTGALTSNGWAAHSGAGNKTIMSDGSAASLEQSGGSGEDINLAFAALGATDKVYAGFDLTLASGQTVNPDGNGLYFAHFKDSGFTFVGRTGVLSPASSGDFVLAINADDSDLGSGTSWASDLSFDTTYRVVISYDAATGTSQLWVDPVNEASTNVSHTASSGTLVEAFALRQSNDYTGSQLIDNVSVATTFSEALTIPEPASLALLGLGGLAMLRRRTA